MNKKLLAGLAAASFLAGGGGMTAVAGVGAPAATASTAAVAASTSRMPPGHGPLESLVAKGTITKAQAIAIHNAFVAYVRGHWRSTLDAVLGPLVKNHTISQAQANAVITAVSHEAWHHGGDPAAHHGPRHHRHSMP